MIYIFTNNREWALNRARDHGLMKSEFKIIRHPDDIRGHIVYPGDSIWSVYDPVMAWPIEMFEMRNHYEQRLQIGT